MTVARLVLPQPLPHQVPELEHPARFKVWNWGRRRGKSRAAVVAAICGHGPADPRTGAPIHRGALHGGDVIWLAPDYKQASIIWREVIEPRFRQMAGVKLDQTNHDVYLPNGGALLLRSCENPDAVRGSGSRLLGVILDEFANASPLVERQEYVWRSVVRPACMDNKAWAIFATTPRRGSFYNTEIALRAKQGTRGPNWHYSHGDARTNSRIDLAEFDELVSEYPAESEQLREEVFAELLDGGAGLAFPEFDRRVHVSRALRAMPVGWRFAAGLDWGYSKRNGYYCLVAFGPERQKVVVWERVFGEMHASDAATAIMNESAHWPAPEFIAADEAMWNDGNAVGLTVATAFLTGLRAARGIGAPPMIEAPHRAGSRLARKNLLHAELAYRPTADGSPLPVWQQPKLTISDACPELARCLETLPRDEKKPEDVDTKAWDHPYDGLTYLLAMDPPQGVQPARATPQDRHPGLDPATGARRDRALQPWEQQAMTTLEEGGAPDWRPSYENPRSFVKE